MSDRPIRPLRVLPVIDKVTVDVALDPYLSLTALSSYGGISKRKLRDYIHDPVHPLPAYQVGGGGPFLVRRSEFDRWMESHRLRPRVDVDRIVEDVLAKRARPGARPTNSVGRSSLCARFQGGSR